MRLKENKCLVPDEELCSEAEEEEALGSRLPLPFEEVISSL